MTSRSSNRSMSSRAASWSGTDKTLASSRPSRVGRLPLNWTECQQKSEGAWEGTGGCEHGRGGSANAEQRRLDAWSWRGRRGGWCSGGSLAQRESLVGGRACARVGTCLEMSRSGSSCLRLKPWWLPGVSQTRDRVSLSLKELSSANMAQAPCLGSLTEME